MTRWKGRDQESTSYSLAVTASVLVLIAIFFFRVFRPEVRVTMLCQSITFFFKKISFSFFLTGKTGPLPQFGSFISRLYLEYFHTTVNVSILWNWTKL